MSAVNMKLIQKLRNRSEQSLEKIDENSETISDENLARTWPPSKSLVTEEKADLLTPDYKPRPKSTSFSSSTSAKGSRDKVERRKASSVNLAPTLSPISSTQSCIDVSSTSMRPTSSLLSIDDVVPKHETFSKSTSQLDSMEYNMKNKRGGSLLNGKIKRNLDKKRSISSPVMNTNSSRSFEDLAIDDDDAFASNSINKKFHKLFKNVSEEERVLDRYACALVSDILLQGQIYITDNYFAFYSNVLFGHVTRVLIPVTKVTDIRKVKMVKVIPNAVKVITPNKKFTFGSLLSRETTYKLMYKVWKRQKQREFAPIIKLKSDIVIIPELLERDSASQTSSERVSVPSEEEELDDGVLAISPSIEGNLNERLLPEALSTNSLDQTDSKTSSHELVADKTSEEKPSFILSILGTLSPTHWLKTRLKASVNILNRLPRTTVFLAMCTVVLIFLYISAAFLIYRLNMLYGHAGSTESTGTEERYHEVFSYKTLLHSASISQLHDALNTQIQELVDVRKSLETLRLVTASVQVEEAFQKPNMDDVLKKRI